MIEATVDWGLGISDCGLFAGRAVLIEATVWIADFGFRISDWGLRIICGTRRFDRSHCGLGIGDFGLRIICGTRRFDRSHCVDCGFRISDFGLGTSDYLRECAVLIEATVDWGLGISDCGLFAGMRRFDRSHCGLGIGDFGLRIICGNAPF